MRTYVIEPQTVFVSYLTKMLSDAGLDVVATGSDVDARDLAVHEPAAVFVDVDFFEKGAANALCRIRQTTASAAVIVLSDTDDPTFEASCYLSGATTVLSKRAPVDQLIALVRGVAGRDVAVGAAT